jgi:hypothetical protein
MLYFLRIIISLTLVMKVLDHIDLKILSFVSNYRMNELYREREEVLNGKRKRESEKMV